MKMYYCTRCDEAYSANDIKELIDMNEGFCMRPFICPDCWDDLQRLDLEDQLDLLLPEIPKKHPLTIKQIQRMRGQTVYIERINGAKPIAKETVMAVGTDDIALKAEDGAPDYAKFALYGKTWLAYARNPEVEA